MICVLYVPLYILWLAKGMFQDEVMLSSAEVKPITLSMFRVCLAASVSQLICQLISVENPAYLFICFTAKY